MREDKPESNKPEPKNECDRILLSAITRLDQDQWDKLIEDHELQINGVLIKRREYPRGGRWSVKTGLHDVDRVHWQAPSDIYFHEIFRDAHDKAMTRYEDKALARKRADIEDDEWAEKEKERRRKEFQRDVEWRAANERRRRIVNWIITGAVATAVAVVGWFGSGLVSDWMTPPPERVKLDVNAYGFEREDFPHRRQYDYPGDCFNGKSWSDSLPRCKSNLERWEASGEAWVNWHKDNPHK